MDTNEHESDEERGLQPASPSYLRFARKRPEGRAPRGVSPIRVDSCSFVVHSGNKNASNHAVRGGAFIHRADER